MKRGVGGATMTHGGWCVPFASGNETGRTRPPHVRRRHAANTAPGENKIRPSTEERPKKRVCGPHTGSHEVTRAPPVGAGAGADVRWSGKWKRNFLAEQRKI